MQLTFRAIRLAVSGMVIMAMALAGVAPAQEWETTSPDPGDSLAAQPNRDRKGPDDAWWMVEQNREHEGADGQRSSVFPSSATSRSGSTLTQPLAGSQSNAGGNDNEIWPSEPAVTTRGPAVPSQLAGASSSRVTPPDKQSTNKQVGTTEFTLAAQPQFGDRAPEPPPQTDRFATPIEPNLFDFGPTPVEPDLPYDAGNEIWVYEGKTLNANQRPLVELGKPWYQLGQLKPGGTILGRHNLLLPQFLIYGDYRMAYANSRLVGGDTTSQVAFELNLNFDWRITATERFVMFTAPLDQNNLNTRWLLDEDQIFSEANADILFGMFEGDLGAITGGLVGQTMPFDLPFAIGQLPMLVQNGVWMEDVLLGVAATIPARNSRKLDISNMDITFLAAFDEIDSDAFEGNNNAASLYGVLTWIEACGGYIEIDYAFLEDRDRLRDRSYHNIGIAYSRRYGRFISNSVRVIGNAGQQVVAGLNTADGVLLLLENSLITSRAQTFVPYLNLFAGFGRPQSAARAAVAGGILRNAGILFESDGMTAFPTLDPTAINTWGGAIGLNILTPNFDQQLVLELATVQTLGNDATRNIVDAQYGVGARYQIPISNSWLIRTDFMYGFLRKVDDIHGARLELRHKF